MSGDGTGTSGLGPAHDLDGPEDPCQETGEGNVVIAFQNQLTSSFSIPFVYVQSPPTYYANRVKMSYKQKKTQVQNTKTTLFVVPLVIT